MSIERLGDDVRVRPAGKVAACVRLPGSKSLTNRYLTCAALADGDTTLTGASLSDDTHQMIEALRSLGIRVATDAHGPEIQIGGCRGHLPADTADLDLGLAGTAMRFVTALTCLGYGRYRIDGAPRMRARPIGQLVGALNTLGAGIGYDAVSGFPPLTLVARGLTGGQVAFDRPVSSQFVSAVLMIAPYAATDVLVRVTGELTSRPYVDMTTGVMRAMGVETLASNDGRFIVPSTQRYRAGRFAIEPDASAASYFWAAAAITGGCVRVAGLSRASAQGDVAFVDVLERMGCEVEAGEDYLEIRGPEPGRLRGVTEDLNAMPDVVQTLAVTALFAEGPTHVRNVANLRVKETDRIAALERELTRLGARVDVHADGLTVFPPKRITPAEIETYDDHRMAMSFAVAGLATEGVTIKNAGCVSKSFPGFFDVLAGLDPTGEARNPAAP